MCLLLLCAVVILRVKPVSTDFKRFFWEGAPWVEHCFFFLKFVTVDYALICFCLFYNNYMTRTKHLKTVFTVCTVVFACWLKCLVCDINFLRVFSSSGVNQTCTTIFSFFYWLSCYWVFGLLYFACGFFQRVLKLFPINEQFPFV